MSIGWSRRAGLATLAVLATFATSAVAQSRDTVRTPNDTLRRADTTRRADSTATKSDSIRDSVTAPIARSATAKSGKTKYQPDPNIPETSGAVKLGVDLTQRVLTIYADGAPIKTFNVAVGMEGKPTPTGTYHISKIVWNPSWIPPDQPWAKGKTAKDPGEPGNPMKVAKIFIKEPDYYIHGTGEVGSLGSAESHGCIRMHPDEVAALAKFLMEHGGNPQEEGWFSRVIHMRWQTHTITLPDPITLVITE